MKFVRLNFIKDLVAKEIFSVHNMPNKIRSSWQAETCSANLALDLQDNLPIKFLGTTFKVSKNSS